jgi:RNA polymerase sigma-70 factor (ECF subfamily)
VCAVCPTELSRDLDGSFATFVEHHQDLVYSLALRWSPGRPSDAEDLAQDVFVRAYRALREYSSDRIAALRARGWLASIVLNLARNRARRQSPRTTPLDSVDQPSHDPVDTDPRTRPQIMAERREASREWGNLLERLPPRYRTAVELRHVHGLSYQELAEALGRPVGTVKSDVHRGVALLREAWEAMNTTRLVGAVP